MKKLIILCFGLLLLVFGCKVYDNTKVSHKAYPVETMVGENQAIDQTIEPYKLQLAKEMNEVIGYCEMDMEKGKPESLLGNWTADAILNYTQSITDKQIDFSVVNYGGLRVGQLQKGDITLSNIYELMPFDNALVIIPISGEPLMQLFKTIHYNGGWPVSSGVKMKVVKNELAVSINGKPIESDYLFHLLISDYVANGGDNCSFLTPLPRESANILFRDALIEYVKAETEAGRKLSSKIENRIVYGDR